MEWNAELHVFAGLFDSTQAQPGERALRDASFESLRAPGAFVVSAQFADGLTQWVRVTSEKGRPLVRVWVPPYEPSRARERNRTLFLELLARVLNLTVPKNVHELVFLVWFGVRD